MTALIAQTGLLWRSSVTGSEAEVIVDGATCNAIEAWEAVDKLLSPVGKINAFLILEDGSRVILPFVGLTYRTPDRTGVIALFEPGQYLKSDGSDHFPYPNNAAIFNADGTLRFQLHNPQGAGSYIGSLHTRTILRPTNQYGATAGPDYAEPIKQFGVLIGGIGHPPEWFYAFDGIDPELKSTGQWVRF